MMHEPSTERWEKEVKRLARDLPYPPTPDVSEAVGRRLRPAATRGRTLASLSLAGVALFLCALLLAVPTVRAGVIDFIQIGAIRIIPATPLPTGTPAASAAPVTATPGREPLPTATRLALPTPPLSPTPTVWVQGETTLAQAQAELDFPIRLPTYPPELGPPDEVYVQKHIGPMLFLVWWEEVGSERRWLALHQFEEAPAVTKLGPSVLFETTVGGQRAFWAEGPYPLILGDGAHREGRIVEGNVLIWAEGTVTYRLESALSLEEARRIAKSLEPCCLDQKEASP